MSKEIHLASLTFAAIFLLWQEGGSRGNASSGEGDGPYCPIFAAEARTLNCNLML